MAARASGADARDDDAAASARAAEAAGGLGATFGNEPDDGVAVFFEAFGEASRRMAYSRIEQRLADRHGLDLLAFRLMLHLRREGSRVGDLAHSVVAHASHTSRALAVLQARGWITRTATRADRRVVIVSPTAPGWDACVAIRTELRGALAERVRDWTPDELRAATAAMRRLAEAL